MNWEMRDAIADSVKPVLGILALVWRWLRWRDSWRPAAFSVVATLFSVAFAYAIAALDGQLRWWASLGLDFSTHTAVTVALVVSLCAIKPSSWFTWVAVLAAYVALMLYQRYHTLSDILTTAAVIGLPLIMCRWPQLRVAQSRSAPVP